MPQVRSLVTPRRAIGAGVAAMLVLGSAAALGATLTPPSVSLPALPSVIPDWAKTAQVMGETPGDQTVFVGLTLKNPEQAALAAYGKAASTPGNALYRHYLSIAQFEARYAPAAATMSTVTGLLKTLGVTDIKADKLGMSIMATMPASLASSIFGVTFQQVMHGGFSTRVAMNQPTLPSTLLPYVTDISGLTQERVHLGRTVDTAVKTAVIPPVTVPGVGAPPAYFNAGPESSYYGEKPATDKPQAPVLSGETAPPGATTSTKPYLVSGYTPAQIRGAYGVTNTTYTGKGVTAGVVLFYDGQYVPTDLAKYSTEYKLAAPDYTDLSPENQITSDVVGSAVLDPIDAAGEQTLDVEAIHLMAPDASIIYSGAVAPEDEPIYVAEDTAIAGGAQVINNSYGGTGDTDAADAQAFATSVTEPAMAVGTGLNYSSGDSGDDVTADGKREADFPTTSDEVTSVGGTGIEIGKNNDYEGEYYWGTYSTPALATGDISWKPFASQAGGAGGGGGLSTAFAEPTWQQGIVPAEETENADTAKSAGETTGIGADSPGRVVPDVAMIADSTTGMLVGETQIPDIGTDGVAGDGTATYSHYRIGGTSVSSPIFTGMMALVDDALTVQAGTSTSAGFVNPTMYPFLAKHDGSFRDPQIGRTPTGSRLGSSMAQTQMGCSSTTVATRTCTGAGPGVVPVVAEVRPDYADTGNDGVTDATSGTASGPNTVSYHLRGQGVLGTLEDLPGYDDSTGLGSPYAPQFIQDFLPSTGSSPTPTPSSASPSATPSSASPSPSATPTSASPSPSATPTSASPSPSVTPTSDSPSPVASSASPSPSVTPTTDSPSPVASSASPSPVMTTDSPTPAPVMTSASPSPSQTTASPTASPTATSTPTATPAPVVTIKPTGPATVLTMSCAVRSSSIKVSAPTSTRLGRHGQLPYAFKLSVASGKCKTPSAVGRQFFVYVDGKKVATLRTGKNGVQNYLVRLKPGKHTITASFVGNKDLKKSTSNRVVTHVI